jgi:SAM-dependent methyltransferase
MDTDSLRALLTPAGQAALAEAAALGPSEATFLRHLARLEKRHPAGLARAALETALLRERARAKFARADAMYFTREALEQATGERVARHRAARFAGLGRVADLGCGLGGDTLALAERGPVVAVDRDPLRLALARANTAAAGHDAEARFVQADLLRLPLAGLRAFFFDPARRADGRRRFSVRDYQPPLAAARAWLAQMPAGAIKISPGVDLEELAGYDAEIEFVSEDGDLKECALWFGPLKTAERRATLLRADGTHSLLPDPAAERALGPPGPVLYEPDPAVLRAGLVTTLAARLGARQLDADIAYLAADEARPTPFARAFAIEDAMPFQLKRLRERLRGLGVGAVTVKKRGSPIEPEDLIRQLRLPRKAPESRIVFLTHVRGEAWALIGRELR